MQFRHSPLPSTGSYIRLLELHPGQHQDDIHVSLDKTLSLERSADLYEALSYAWGSPHDPVKVRVSFDQETYVGSNLASALRHLRREDAVRLLWVDALCINQSDDKERSCQVAMMGGIYQSAQVVVVWLGPANRTIASAFESLNIIGSDIEVDWYNYTYKHACADNVTIGSRDAEILAALADRRQASALTFLFARAWFERLWVRQEVGLARAATVVAGNYQVSWKTLTSAVYIINHRANVIRSTLGQTGESLTKRVAQVLPVCSSRLYFLDSMRHEVSRAKCSDPRDRIYAVLSLMHSNYKDLGIIPQYSLTVTEVYADATLRFIDAEASLSILLQCELSDERASEPTWVPDFSTEMSSFLYSGAPNNASVYLQAVTRYKGDGILSVAGVRVATIERVMLMTDGFLDKGLEHVVGELWEFLRERNRGKSNKCATESSKLRLLCETLACGMFQHATIPPRNDWPRFDICAEILACLIEKDGVCATREDLQEDEARKYYLCIRKFCLNRVFFATTDGAFGLAPHTATMGDEICVFLGCDSSMVARPCPNGKYRLVGQSYVSGVNAGEALAGPLPDHLRSVTYLTDTKDAFYFGYLDTGSGKVRFHDPRLYVLPIDIGYHEQLWDKGQFERIKVDPQALRAAGYPVQDFDIV